MENNEFELFNSPYRDVKAVADVINDYELGRAFQKWNNSFPFRPAIGIQRSIGSSIFIVSSSIIGTSNSFVDINGNLLGPAAIAFANLRTFFIGKLQLSYFVANNAGTLNSLYLRNLTINKTIQAQVSQVLSFSPLIPVINPQTILFTGDIDIISNQLHLEFSQTIAANVQVELSIFYDGFLISTN